METASTWANFSVVASLSTLAIAKELASLTPLVV